MKCSKFIHIISAVFCLHVFLCAGCSQEEEKKQGVAAEPKGEKTMDAQYSFNFADLRDDYIRQNYVTIPYNIHQNKLFNFSILMNKNWNAVKIAEPSELPLDGTLAEIGLFKLFSPSHDPNGDIKAQIIIYITGIPQKISAADYLDKQIPVIYKDKGFKIIQSKTIDTNFGTSKDVLFSYTSDNTLFLSRICAFKVKDDTKAYFIGEKELLYLIQLTVQEKDYEAFGAEPFYVSKVSVNVGTD